ncbi:8285_t:CDS:2 [Entrophospora sp. SA101]|nr:8285_t:CDS:2 [Entrophospora sp. SA101]CAJ0913654.1 12121_t:CDS:2 [Entrophospora sp. SA101]
MDYQRQLLEELMAPFQSSSKHTFWDDAVCKHYLVKFCPNSLFTNTKSDLGPCTKVHDEKLRQQYQEAADRSKYGYETKFYDYLTVLCNDLDKKIRKGNERLNVRPDDTLLNPNKDEKEEKIIILDEKIKELLVKIEEAGEEGRVQEAQTLTKEVESLQKDLDFLRNVTVIQAINLDLKTLSKEPNMHDLLIAPLFGTFSSPCKEKAKPKGELEQNFFIMERNTYNSFTSTSNKVMIPRTYTVSNGKGHSAVADATKSSAVFSVAW